MSPRFLYWHPYFLIKCHTKNDADRMFNLLKRGQDGEDIWTDAELDDALTKKNKEFIDLFRLDDGHMKAWTKGLNHNNAVCHQVRDEGCTR